MSRFSLSWTLILKFLWELASQVPLVRKLLAAWHCQPAQPCGVASDWGLSDSSHKPVQGAPVLAPGPQLWARGDTWSQTLKSWLQLCSLASQTAWKGSLGHALESG